ncbi:MAG: prepilin-type N-terminal cleavage/methylation domain-containing protein [Armatimonadota bacterium]
MRKAFTLIELLVVIAIIAILAAILFPVFAQAKAAAKKTAALSNAKNIGTASMIYASDADDRFPSVFDGGNGGDPIRTMDPYIKNLDIWSQYRQNKDKITRNADGSINYGNNDIGYNWGWEIRGAEAMLNEEKCTGGGAVQGCSTGRYNTGKSNSEMANPASLYAFGNTYDTPRQTMGGIGWFFDDYPGGLNANSRNSGIYFGGSIVTSFADGHAKSVAWKGGYVAAFGEYVGSPKNFNDRVNGYCADPDARINPFPRSGFPLGSMVCRDFLAFPEATGVTWWRD